MLERLTDPGAGNWVDRGQAAEPELTRLLAAYIGRDPASPPPDLRSHVDAIRGMVEADSTEVQIAGYLKVVDRAYDVPDDSSRRRACGIALWHITKCAEVRDRARRLMDHGLRT
jgi:hypothetical protein